MVRQGKPVRYFITTFGCRVNQADAAGVAQEMEAYGYERTSDVKEAEVVILNTCTVTHRSDVDVRKTVARINRDSPDARVVVTGCFAQRDPKAAAQLQGVSMVVGNSHKHRLPVITDQLPVDEVGQTSVVHTPLNTPEARNLPVEPTTSVLNRTRPFVKIQDGCDARCTYCIIPYVRGPSRGAPPQKIVTAVRKLISEGYFEIVLTGIHLGTYSYTSEDGTKTQLNELIRKILTLPGLGRLRISCIEPMAFPIDLVRQASKDRKLAPHFHLPLQSGSDHILKRMLRPYQGQDFINLMQKIREYVPEGCLGTDVIVGFPGETEEDFETTINCIKASGVNYVHVFSYSDRHAGTGRGTPSTRLEAKVDPRIIKDRSTRLNALSRELWQSYLNNQVGRTLSAVILEPDARHPGQMRALADNFCKIECHTSLLRAGSPVNIRITERRGERLVGNPVIN
ncbi:MAG: tRNA (N(6)-L-threonylcarbamoyladenosine(37)-C(2))-methylthiotransferase MtaB [Myxococcales bacterium]|nr:tRNA (N(6)-L-threonylcarbamoyladenosine(37)-C(2))-methylthiotransferase MtaB [Myxococcales bacterium]